MRIPGALAACSNGIASRSPIPVLTTVRICVADSKLVRPEIENLKCDRDAVAYCHFNLHIHKQNLFIGIYYPQKLLQ